jgi:hypothetical protein
MTGEKRMFSSYEKNDDPQRAITFEDGNQGLGKIAISPDHSISNVFLIDSCHTRVLGIQSPVANINTRCAGTKSHTYDA